MDVTYKLKLCSPHVWPFMRQRIRKFFGNDLRLYRGNNWEGTKHVMPFVCRSVASRKPSVTDRESKSSPTKDSTIKKKVLKLASACRKQGQRINNRKKPFWEFPDKLKLPSKLGAQARCWEDSGPACRTYVPSRIT
ncbi:unnamed protein product [Allacma fusca]|uniref:Uncharacterized protein n=1 Tax=Allacma fusca TaxID=39272 RepID=A0A8J2LNP6_9HEXA|nr:unnamed protein product [Allacma fusca]